MFGWMKSFLVFWGHVCYNSGHGLIDMQSLQNKIRMRVWDQVEDRVWDEVGGEVRDQVEDELS